MMSVKSVYCTTSTHIMHAILINPYIRIVMQSSTRDACMTDSYNYKQMIPTHPTHYIRSKPTPNKNNIVSSDTRTTQSHSSELLLTAFTRC